MPDATRPAPETSGMEYAPDQWRIEGFGMRKWDKFIETLL